MQTVIFVAMCVFGTVVIILSALWGTQKVQNRQLQDELAGYKDTFRLLPTWDKQEVRSFDGGKTWYMTERQPDGSLVVVGPADPNVVSDLQRLTDVFKHWKDRQPLDREQRELFERTSIKGHWHLQ